MYSRIDFGQRQSIHLRGRYYAAKHRNIPSKGIFGLLFSKLELSDLDFVAILLRLAKLSVQELIIKYLHQFSSSSSNNVPIVALQALELVDPSISWLQCKSQVGTFQMLPAGLKSDLRDIAIVYDIQLVGERFLCPDAMVFGYLFSQYDYWLFCLVTLRASERSPFDVTLLPNACSQNWSMSIVDKEKTWPNPQNGEKNSLHSTGFQDWSFPNDLPCKLTWHDNRTFPSHQLTEGLLWTSVNLAGGHILFHICTSVHLQLWWHLHWQNKSKTSVSIGQWQLSKFTTDSYPDRDQGSSNVKQLTTTKDRVHSAAFFKPLLHYNNREILACNQIYPKQII